MDDADIELGIISIAMEIQTKMIYEEEDSMGNSVKSCGEVKENKDTDSAVTPCIIATTMQVVELVIWLAHAMSCAECIHPSIHPSIVPSSFLLTLTLE